MSDRNGAWVGVFEPLPMPDGPELRCCVSCGASYRADFSRCPSDGAEIKGMDLDPLIGAVLEPYVIQELLGEGSMGRVYRAHHARLDNRRYAIKILRGDLASTSVMRARFAKEAETASKLSHPNVVSVVDVGRSKTGLLYLAMELVDGASLASLIECGPLAPARVVRLVRGICAGLAHAHEHGLIHRDLKPDNVMIVDGPDGEVPRITDFGIAISAVAEDARLTATGYTLGTPAYVSPEQTAIGAEIDRRVDLYALGVTMYEMLTGQLPFEGAAMEQMVAKTTRDPPAFAARGPGTTASPELERVVRKLMARRPSQRYATASDVIGALDAIGDPGALAPNTEVAARLGRRRVGIAAVLGLVLILAAVVAWRLTASSDVESVTGAAVSSSATPTAVTMTVIDPGPAPAPASAPVPASGSTPAPAPASTEAPAIAAPDRAGDDRKRRSRDRASQRAKPSATARTAPAVVAATTTAAAAPARSTPTAAPPQPTSAPPPPPAPPVRPIAPVAIEAAIADISVEGSLAAGVVRRAVNRKLTALSACGTTSDAVTIRFVVGESRRASGASVTGGSPVTRRCVEDVVAGIRTESAPDVGDAEVTLRIAYAPRPR